MGKTRREFLGIALFPFFVLAHLPLVSAEPNILIIVTDDQGYADLSAFEHHAEDVHTPNMDRLAARGVLFTSAYAPAAVCSPSRAGWNTGRHQVRWDPKSSFNCGLPEGTPTLAQMLKDHGYATAKIGKNDFGGSSLHRRDVYEYPLSHGYDEFLGFSAHGHDFFLLSKEIQNRTPDPAGHSAVVGPLMHNRGTKEFKDSYLTEIFTDAAIEFLKRHSDGNAKRQRGTNLESTISKSLASGHEDHAKPFYLTLSYNSVHHLIHQSPKRYLDKFGVKEIPNYDPDKDGRYADWFKRFITLSEISDEEMRRYYLANLNCLDDNVGRVLDALDEFGLAGNTVVIFFSDNGGPPTNGAWNLPLAGSKFTLWEGGIRVPFIISRPGDSHVGEIWNQPISTLDVVPTCLEAAGIKLPEILDGQPIPKSANAFKEPRNLFWRWNNSFAVRSGEWKLLHNGGRSGRKPTSGIINRTELLKGTRLFDLREDPGESRDLADEHPEVVQRLKMLYAQWSQQVAGGLQR